MSDDLHSYLSSLPPGPVANPTDLERLLVACWHEFTGDDGGMEAYKLLGRTEQVVWQPPKLSFPIERHGGTVMGSSRATLQEWTIDVEQRTAHCIEASSRQLRPMQRRVEMKPQAEEIALRQKHGRTSLFWHCTWCAGSRSIPKGLYTMNIATGLNFGPLPDGNVLIEFYGSEGKTFNEQIVTAAVIRSMPFVAVLTDIAREIMEKLTRQRTTGR